MSLIRWSPFLMPRWSEEFGKMFEGLSAVSAAGFTPAIDMYETKDAVVVKAPLAGVDPKDVEVCIENGVLTVKGQTKKEHEVKEKDFYRQEVRYGSFHRQIALPVLVLDDQAKAEFENGMLNVTIPKSAQTRSKTVKVNVKK